MGNGRYKRIRDFVVSLDEGKCRCCGNDENLSVHHIVPSGGDDPGNLICVCVPCGKRIHGRVLRFGGSRMVPSEVSASKIFNIAVLREMRLTGERSSQKISHRADFIRRRKEDPRKPLSKKVQNLARVIEDRLFDVSDGPWAFDFGDFEVVIRSRGSG